MKKVALIGCGLIAGKRAKALPEGYGVATLFDIDRNRADSLASTIPGSKAVVTAEEAVDGADLAVVATYHRDLVPMGRIAIAAGCDVLLEKPGGRSAVELRELQHNALALNKTIHVGYNHRFHPSVMKARALVKDGGFGKLLHVRARYGHGGRPGYDKEWRADKEISGGGQLMDQTVHLIDLTRYFFGEVTLAFAELRTDFWNCPVEDNAYLALRVQPEGFAWLHASWTEWRNLFSFEIALERAKLEISGLGGSYGVEKLTLYEMLPEMGPPDITSWEWPRADTSWSDEMNALAGGQPGSGAPATLGDAIAVLEVVDRAYSNSQSAPTPPILSPV
jgi:predicted dehydrogenase